MAVTEEQTVIYNKLILSYKGPWIGVRHIFAFLGFLGFVNVYAMRVNLSVAIVAMVNSTNQNDGKHNISDGTCPADIAPMNSTDNNNDAPFNWDAETQSLVLGCFFYGYVLTQLPGGRLAEILGGKWIFGFGILLTSIFTVIMPWAAKTDLKLLVAVRVIEGNFGNYVPKYVNFIRSIDFSFIFLAEKFN